MEPLLFSLSIGSGYKFLNKHIINNTIKLRVIPNSSKLELKEENNQLKLYLTAIPDKDRANKQLIKFFKKKYNLKVTIQSGSRIRDKLLSFG